MTSLLTPGYALTLGTQLWTQQLRHLEVKLTAAPLVDSLSAYLPVSAPLSASLGDPVELKLNNGEKEALVFMGSIGAIRYGLKEIRVSALNAGGSLAGFRPAITYEQVSAGTVIKNLAQEVGVKAGDVVDGVSLTFYAADPARTALEHVARVSAWSGALARISAGNEVESVIINATQAEVALKYGRELLWMDQMKAPAAVQSFTVAGEGGAGEPSDPEALTPSLDFFAGNRPAGPSADHRWGFEPALRTAAAAATAGAARQRRYNSSRERGRLAVFLQPDLRPGTVLEIQELPETLSGGPVWAYRVQHCLGFSGAYSLIHFYKGGDSFDPRALLGSLLGAIGGLL